MLVFSCLIGVFAVKKMSAFINSSPVYVNVDKTSVASASEDDLSALIAEAKAALPNYKTSLQDGDYYASDDANHGLRSHYFVDGT